MPAGYLQNAAEYNDPWAPLRMTLVAIPAYATPMAAMVQLDPPGTGASGLGWLGFSDISLALLGVPVGFFAIILVSYLTTAPSQRTRQFVDDIHLPNMVEAAVLRSPYAHARISGIDAAEALAMPGVHAVITHADLPESLQQPIPLLVPNPAIRYPVMQYVLAKDAVRFAGEAVAVVVADDRYIAEDAAERINAQ